MPTGHRSAWRAMCLRFSNRTIERFLQRPLRHEVGRLGESFIAQDAGDDEFVQFFGVALGKFVGPVGEVALTLRIWWYLKDANHDSAPSIECGKNRISIEARLAVSKFIFEPGYFPIFLLTEMFDENRPRLQPKLFSFLVFFWILEKVRKKVHLSTLFLIRRRSGPFEHL